MPEFLAEIIIEGKKNARDPEGETIMRDLMIKHGYDMVDSVRSGKILKVKLEAKDDKDAEDICFNMVNELRIYNPVAHVCTIKIVK
ncbi:MAG TPA: phosphoribosylformylglycinamidine synthase subunit PurS [candidate division Zixibacteria bacterium]|nr:phosphoribosylformylglycinamidine synthase subunit PurS [candidate division Zixibacteria bacterium]